MPHLLSKFRRPFKRPQGQERVGMQSAEGIAPQSILPEGWQDTDWGKWMMGGRQGPPPPKYTPAPTPGRGGGSRPTNRKY